MLWPAAEGGTVWSALLQGGRGAAWAPGLRGPGSELGVTATPISLLHREVLEGLQEWGRQESGPNVPQPPASQASLWGTRCPVTRTPTNLEKTRRPFRRDGAALGAGGMVWSATRPAGSRAVSQAAAIGARSSSGG